MFEDFDEDSGSDSSGSSLPGPDEFMRRARVELARRRSPNRPMTGKERFTAGGVSALMAASNSPGSPAEGANQARTKTMANEDDERICGVEGEGEAKKRKQGFLHACKTPGRGIS